jgi:hypothetical protein
MSLLIVNPVVPKLQIPFRLEDRMGETSGAASPALVERTADWLMAQALKDADLKDIVRGCCERLHVGRADHARAVHVYFVAPTLPR